MELASGLLGRAFPLFWCLYLAILRQSDSVAGIRPLHWIEPFRKPNDYCSFTHCWNVFH